MDTVIFSVVGRKGGIGKSTVAVTFSQYLTQIKKMTGGFIDMDSQGNSSSALIKTVTDP